MKVDTKPKPLDDVPGFPSFKRRPEHVYSDEDIEEILDGGSVQGRRNWLTGRFAKGEITEEQRTKFWPGWR